MMLKHGIPGRPPPGYAPGSMYIFVFHRSCAMHSFAFKDIENTLRLF